jgi:hypothetical protein
MTIQTQPWTPDPLSELLGRMAAHQEAHDRRFDAIDRRLEAIERRALWSNGITWTLILAAAGYIVRFAG